MKKVIAIILGAITLFCFSACTDNSNDEDYVPEEYRYIEGYVPEYNAVFYDDAEDMLQENYRNENYVKVTGSIDDTDNSTPKERTLIITDSENYNTAFAENSEIDFSNKMVIIYTFATEYYLSAFLTDMAFEGDTLTFDYTIPCYWNAGSAGQPHQRWFVVVLDKLEITSVIFEDHISYYYNV